MASIVVHPYDYVRIINPSFFVRCGYPLSYEDEVDHIRTEHMHDIEIFCRKLGVSQASPGDAAITSSRLHHRIARAVAYDIMRAKKFGGQERKIHTTTLPDFYGKTFHAQSIRFVRTGTYEPAYGNGEDYEPPALNDAKMHRIVLTPFIRPTLYSFGSYNTKIPHLGDFAPLEIESNNLEVLATPRLFRRRKCSETTLLSENGTSQQLTGKQRS